MHDEIYRELNIRVEEAEHCACVLTSPLIKPIGEAFAHNIENIQHVLAIPLLFISQGVQYERMRATTDAVIQKAMPGVKTPISEADFDKAQEIGLFEECHRQMENLSASLPEDAYDCAKGLLDNFATDAKGRNALKSMLDSAVTSGQTAFESLCRDLEYCERIRGEHGFKTEFTKRKNALFDNPDLKELQGIRHIIVHRCGIVDKDFIKDTSCSDDVGKPIGLNGKRISRLLNAAIMGGCELLMFSDKWVADHLNG